MTISVCFNHSSYGPAFENGRMVKSCIFSQPKLPSQASAAAALGLNCGLVRDMRRFIGEFEKLV